MTAQPASEVVEAFNAVLRLSGEDVDALHRATWRFRGMWRRDPGNGIPGLGLMVASQLLGQRGDAIETGSELWGRRIGMGRSERAVLASLFAAVGCYDRAIELVAEGIGDGQNARTAIEAIIMGTWNPSFPGFSLPRGSPAFRAVIDEMNRIGLLPHMQERQTMVNDLIGPHQCNTATSAGTDGGEGVILTRMVYTDLDLKQNLELAEAVSEAERSFYEARAIDPDAACYLVTEVLLPAWGQLPLAEPFQAEMV